VHLASPAGTVCSRVRRPGGLCVVLVRNSWYPAVRISPATLACSTGILLVHSERLFFVNFSVKIRHQNQVSLIDVSGHLTFFEVGALGNSIQSLLKERRKNIVLNLSGLGYLDSSGIGELARIYVAVVKQGGAMKVIGLTPKVEEVLKITHLSQVFQEFPDEQSALLSFPANS
jgi:anti-sigma B factor antagonist